MPLCRAVVHMPTARLYVETPKETEKMTPHSYLEKIKHVNNLSILFSKRFFITF